MLPYTKSLNILDTEGLNKTEFMEAIELSTFIGLGQYDDDMLADVNKAIQFEYTDWPYDNDVIRNRNQITKVQK